MEIEPLLNSHFNLIADGRADADVPNQSSRHIRFALQVVFIAFVLEHEILIRRMAIKNFMYEQIPVSIRFPKHRCLGRMPLHKRTSADRMEIY